MFTQQDFPIITCHDDCRESLLNSDNICNRLTSDGFGLPHLNGSGRLLVDVFKFDSHRLGPSFTTRFDST